MKRPYAVLCLLVLTALALWGVQRAKAGQETQPPGTFGTVQTAMEATELDGILYLRYPVGPVYDPAGLAAYNLEAGEFFQLSGHPEAEILGICLLDGTLVMLTENALYRYSPRDSGMMCMMKTTGFFNQWLIPWAGELILCRSTMDVESRTQILRLHSDSAEELLWEGETTLLWHPMMTCCWEDCLYARKVGEPMLWVLDLKTGELRELPQKGAVTELYADNGGVVLETEDDGLLRRLSGEAVAQTPSGGFLGCGGQTAYYLESRYGTRSRLYRVGEEAPLTEAFEADLVTEPRGYVAGEYVLFYTPGVLDGTEERDAWVHHLYLLEDGQVKRITSYTQDYPYC